MAQVIKNAVVLPAVQHKQESALTLRACRVLVLDSELKPGFQATDILFLLGDTVEGIGAKPRAVARFQLRHSSLFTDQEMCHDVALAVGSVTVHFWLEDPSVTVIPIDDSPIFRQELTDAHHYSPEVLQCSPGNICLPFAVIYVRKRSKLQ